MYSKFVNWVEENDYLYKNFCDIEKCLNQYLSMTIGDNQRLKEHICNNFNTVLGKCDQISYDEDGVPEAYIILHFLDRYHRFQLMLLDMFRSATFPIKKKIRIMDIGTGPGPSLYAISDMVALYQQYEMEVYGESQIEAVEMDYVEQSQGFRAFLHRMTEILMDYRERIYVPFHFGNYYDASKLDFSGKISREASICVDGAYTYREHYEEKVAKSFDLVVYSNFLTNMDVMVRFEQQLKSAAFYLRNRGKILVVGGNPKDKKYEPVYQRIDELILGQDYQSRKFLGACRKLGEISEMCYSDNDCYGKQIKKFYAEVLDSLTDKNWEEKLETTFRMWMCNYLDSDKQTKWHYEIFERRSKYRRE